jgi:hypothetical protein
MDGYGVVMKPGLALTTPTTLRLGTPVASLVDKILEPVLKERVQPLVGRCTVWRGPPQAPGDAPAAAAAGVGDAAGDAGASVGLVTAAFMSLEFEGAPGEMRAGWGEGGGEWVGRQSAWWCDGPSALRPTVHCCQPERHKGRVVGRWNPTSICIHLSSRLPLGHERRVLQVAPSPCRARARPHCGVRHVMQRGPLRFRC